MTTMVEEAVVLAGGLGTRLRSAVSDVPKALAPIAGRPFLGYLLDRLENAGLTRVIVAIGHRGEQIEAAIGSRHGRLAIVYSSEATPLGTGGALWQALSLCRGERVFALNGDTYFDVDYTDMGRARACDVVVAVRPVPDRERYGSVRLEGRRIVAFAEKGERGPGLVNSGSYLVRRDLVTRVPRTGIFSFERDILEASLEQLLIEAYISDARFVDIGTPEDFARAQNLLPAWAKGQQMS